MFWAAWIGITWSLRSSPEPPVLGVAGRSDSLAHRAAEPPKNDPLIGARGPLQHDTLNYPEMSSELPSPYISKYLLRV